ncbi:MAG: FtsX-like permease family protein [Alphaproteobacteria bacterium]|nr:FtsX-like permease family protein [Alphaproteobacteria bacterium]MCB9974778.1 FtsX-like permease family protein [Rhodospirillales bacterium]
MQADSDPVTSGMIRRLLRLVLGSKGYDLPFKSDTDRNFLLLLVALMSFLAVLACAGTLTLHAMTQRWSSGLENKITIEVKAETPNGEILSPESVKLDTEKIAGMLEGNLAIKSYQVMNEVEIKKLVSPWIGEDFSFDEIPMPGLIAVELSAATPETLETLTQKVLSVAPSARIETHREWLQDILRFVKTLQGLAFLVAMIVVVTTITAISSGVRSRMAIYRNQVEILHLIGAPDPYIARQFQWHAVIVSLLGSVIGTAAGLAVATLIFHLSGKDETALIPEIGLNYGQIAAFIILPLLACLISGTTARFTVLRTLSQMP